MGNNESKELENEKVKETIDKDFEKKDEYSAPNPNNPPINMTLDELVRKLRNEVTTDEYYWYLCYMLTGVEHMDLNRSDLNNGVVRFSGICAQTRNMYEEDIYRSMGETVVITGYHVKNKSPFHYRRLFGMDFHGNDVIKFRCSICTDKQTTPACMYRVNAYIHFVCFSSKIEPREVYKTLCGRLYKPMDIYDSPSSVKGLEKETFEGLDLFSVLAATIMIKNRWIKCDIGMFNIEYTYMDALSNGKTSNIENIKNIYAGKGTTVTVPKKEIKEHALTRNQGAHIKYLYRPERVAAYIMYLADKCHENPTRMGLYIGSLLANKRLGIYDDYRVEQNRQKLKALPLNKEDAETAENLFNYVISRYFNTSIPFMPINMVLYSEDEQETDALIEIFRWVTSFYYYFDGKSPKTYVKDISIADYSMNEIVKIIDNVRFPNEAGKDNITGPLILHIKDFHLLPELDNKSGDTLVKITQLQNALERQSDKVALIISGEKDKLSHFLETQPEFYNMTVDKHLTLGDMSSNQIVYEIMRKLEIQFTFEEGFEKTLKEYVYLTYKKSKLKSKSYIDKVVRDVSFNHYNENIDDKNLKIIDIPKVAGAKSDKDIWEAINALEGLENVKQEMIKLQTLLSFRRKTMGRGIALAERPNLHMIFQGNPGTGKTTVARLLGDLLFNFGYLKENKVIEVSPKDLVAQYVGQTAPKTAAACQSAYGGILFIDEAYELAVGDSNGAQAAFRSECVTELIKQMEDHRDNLVVIFAGYTKDMQKLVDTNAGLASRVGTIMDFTDYTDDQLLNMFKKMVRNSGMILTPEAENSVLKTIRKFKEEEDFGNGRFVRNLYEKTVTQHAYNTIDSDDDSVLATITEFDIADMGDAKKANSKYHIGFV